ncbi:hypothetical protein SEVIR_5G178433v4 [Setaria viridis]
MQNNMQDMITWTYLFSLCCISSIYFTFSSANNRSSIKLILSSDVSLTASVLEVGSACMILTIVRMRSDSCAGLGSTATFATSTSISSSGAVVAVTLFLPPWCQNLLPSQLSSRAWGLESPLRIFFLAWRLATLQCLSLWKMGASPCSLVSHHASSAPVSKIFQYQQRH